MAVHLAHNLKRAPKWAWFTAAGIGVAGAGIKLFKHRAAPADTQTPTDGTSGTDGTQYASGGGATGVIVPPVIMGGTGNGGTDPGLGGLSDLYQSGAQGIIQTYGDVLGAVQSQNESLLGAVLGAGGPPSTVGVNPPPVHAVPDVCTGKYNKYDSGSRQCFRIFTKVVNHRQRVNGAMRDVKVQQTFHEYKGGTPQLVGSKTLSTGNGDQKQGGPARGSQKAPVKPDRRGCFPVGHGPHGVHPGRPAARGKKWAWKCDQWDQVKA